MVTRRNFLRLSAVSVVGGSLLAGCSSGGQGDDAAAPVNVYLAQHAWVDSLKKHLGDFEAESGRTSNITELGENQLQQQYQVKLNAGADDIDVMMFNVSNQGAQLISNGWLADLQSRVSKDGFDWEDFYTPSREMVTGDAGEVWGIPLVSERVVLYYRKDLFESAGIAAPTTFDELAAAAEALHDPDGGVYGFVARGKGNPAVTPMANILYGYGLDWYDEDRQSLLADPKAVEAFTFYGDLLRNFGPPGVLNMDWPQAVAVFQQGQAAMYIEADSLFANFTDPEASRVVDTVGYAPMPAGPVRHAASNITSWGLGMAASSPDEERGWSFLSWATSAGTMAEILKDNNPVTRASAWADPEASSNYPSELVKVINDPGDIEYITHTAPPVVNVGRARDTIGTVISTAINGGDVAAAAEAANVEFQAQLDSE